MLEGRYKEKLPQVIQNSRQQSLGGTKTKINQEKYRRNSMRI
jgi:hypothetical protein